LYHESQASCAGLVTHQFYKEFTKGSQHPKFTQAFIICWHTPAATYVVASPGSDVARDVQVFQGLGLTRLADLRIKNMAPSFLKDHSSNTNIPKENWQSLLPEEPSLTHLEMMLRLESHSEKHLLQGSQ